MNVFELFGRLTIDGIEKVDGQLRSVEDRLNSTGKAMTSMGKTLSMTVTAPLTALGIGAFKAAGDFDQAFRQVNVMLGASAEQAAEYKQRILEISSATGKAATDVTAAYYQIVSAGYRGADSLDILETAMMGAVGGAADATATTAALTKAMNIFQLEGAQGSTQAMDTFFGIVDAGLLSFEELAISFPRAASNAAGLNISIEETGAALATLTKVLGSTEQAATATDAIFRVLISPSEALKQLYDEWGVSSGPEAIAQFGGLTGVLERLQAETDGNVVAIRELFNSDEAMRGVLPLLTSSYDDFTAATNAVTEATGRTSEAFNEMATGPGFQWQQMTNNMRNSAIRLGDAIAGQIGPALVAATDLVTKAVKAFSSLPAPVRTGAVVVGALAAAIGPLLIMFGLSAQGLGAMIRMYSAATRAVQAHQVATTGATIATQGMTASTHALNIALSASKIGLIISAITLLVTGIIALKNNWDKVTGAFDRGLSESERKFKAWARNIKGDADSMLMTVETTFQQMTSAAKLDADSQIAAAEQVRDAEKRSIAERLGYYREFTADKLAEIDKQMVAELAAIDGALGEQAQAYLDMLTEQDEADKERQDKIDARRIQGLKRQLETDEDLTREQRLQMEDQIADYEAQQAREAAADDLYNAIKASDYESYFAGKESEADEAFATENALILEQRDLQLASYQEQLAAFQQLHDNVSSDYESLLDYARQYNDIVSQIGESQIEIPELPTQSQSQPQGTLPNLRYMAGGGDINEPTLLYGLRSQRAYAMAGESGPERVAPVGEAATNITNQFSISQLVVREEADIDRIAEKLYRMQSLRARYA